VSRRRLQLDRSGPWIAVVGLCMVLWCSVSTGLFAPWWGVAVLLVVWGSLLLVGFRWWTPHPVRLAVLPVVSLVVWFGLLMAGVVWFDWAP
jgi:hypothetical protein